MPILETQRLSLRELTDSDAAFILELVNEPDFIKNIRDSGVRNLQGALGYINNGPRASYAKNGFGLWAVELKDSHVPIGMCGLLKRDTLDDVDIGFAFLERFRSKGYATEAAQATMDYGRNVLKIPRIVGITALDNQASGNVLEKIGLHFDKIIPSGDGESRLFVPAD